MQIKFDMSNIKLELDDKHIIEDEITNDGYKSLFEQFDNLSLEQKIAMMKNLDFKKSCSLSRDDLFIGQVVEIINSKELGVVFRINKVNIQLRTKKGLREVKPENLKKSESTIYDFISQISSKTILPLENNSLSRYAGSFVYIENDEDNKSLGIITRRLYGKYVDVYFFDKKEIIKYTLDYFK